MSPTLPWPNHDHKDGQIGNLQGSHPGPKPLKSLESKGMVQQRLSLTTGSIITFLGHTKVMILMKNLLTIPMACPFKANLIHKVFILIRFDPYAEAKAPAVSPVCLQSDPSLRHPDEKNALYAGEGHMPKLVTESCVVEGIPDPRSNDRTVLQQIYDPKSHSDAQDVLPPGPTLRSSPPRDRKSRSVSVSKRGVFNTTRPASFARSVISKVQTGCAKEQLKSCLQTTPHKQKGSTARNKSPLHPPQVDVSKPVATPVPPDVDMSSRKPKNNVDADIVDLVQKFCKEEKEQETLMKTEINDAVHKWCSLYPAAHQARIASFKFRCRISSTICFLVAVGSLLEHLGPPTL